MDEEEYSDEFAEAEEDTGASGRASTAGDGLTAAEEPTVGAREQELDTQLNYDTEQWRDPVVGPHPQDTRSQHPDASEVELTPDPAQTSVAPEDNPSPGPDSHRDPAASQAAQRYAPEDVSTSPQIPSLQLPPSTPVFLSCKWPEGSEWAVALASELERLGVPVKHDARFSNKQAAVEQMITDCSCFVMLVTPGYYQALCNHPNGNRALKEVRYAAQAISNVACPSVPHLGQGS